MNNGCYYNNYCLSVFYKPTSSWLDFKSYKHKYMKNPKLDNSQLLNPWKRVKLVISNSPQAACDVIVNGESNS